MDRWEIRASPSRQDPARHLLLIKGDAADVARILKRFGKLLGRPTAHRGGGFNLQFAVHRLDSAGGAELSAWLETLAPAAVLPVTPAPPPKTLPPPKPPPPPRAPVKPVDKPKAPAPSTAPRPVPRTATPISPIAPVTGTPPPAPAPRGPAYRLDLPLNPTWSFENLVVGAHNRFAHAAVTSVVSSPGVMYNPLVLYGVPCTGKSHMLQATASAMARGDNDLAPILTSGPRLSRAIDLALENGTVNAILKRSEEAGGIFVDDVHLTWITDGNREVLAKFFAGFLKRRRQIVMTSLYSPRFLTAIEEAFKIPFSHGYSTDLKLPTPAVQKEILDGAVPRTGLDSSGDDITVLNERFANWGYQEFPLWVKRLAVLHKMRLAQRQSVLLIDMMQTIHSPVAAGAAEVPAGEFGTFDPPPVSPNAAALAIVAPKGAPGGGIMAARRFQEMAATAGFKKEYRYVSWETFDETQSYGAPFQITERADRGGAAFALIVGPPPDSALGPRSAELSQAVRHLLEARGIKMAWIPFSGLQTEAQYMNAHLDFAPAPDE